jgi:hypothetical protein
VWTWRGFVTYDTVFVIDLASRRVHVLGSTPHLSDLFLDHMVRLATAADDGVLVGWADCSMTTSVLRDQRVG